MCYTAIHCDIDCCLFIEMCCYALVELLLILKCVSYFKDQCLLGKTKNVHSSDSLENLVELTFHSVYHECKAVLCYITECSYIYFTLPERPTLRVQSRNLPPKSKHAHILENVNTLQLYRMSQVSQSRRVGGDASLSYVVWSEV